MAIYDINFFTGQARDANGGVLAVPSNRIGGQRMTGTGAANAAPAGTKLVEIVTDTAVTVNIYGSGTSRLIPAGIPQYFECAAAQVITLS